MADAEASLWGGGGGGGGGGAKYRKSHISSSIRGRHVHGWKEARKLVDN